MISFPATLVSRTRHDAAHVSILRFALPPDEDIPLHHPGQYALLQFGAYFPRAYSMANGADGQFLEFHIRETHSEATRFALHELAIGERISVQGFGGDCLYQTECDRPVVLVGGGTGLAPMLAILEAALRDRPERPVHLYHGVRTADDLYMDEVLTGFSQRFAALSYYPVLSGAANNLYRSGLVGDVLAADLARYVERQEARFYCAGPVEMVRHVLERLQALGISSALIHTDYPDLKYGGVSSNA